MQQFKHQLQVNYNHRDRDGSICWIKIIYNLWGNRLEILSIFSSLMTIPEEKESNELKLAHFISKESWAIKPIQEHIH